MRAAARFARAASEVGGLLIFAGVVLAVIALPVEGSNDFHAAWLPVAAGLAGVGALVFLVAWPFLPESMGRGPRTPEGVADQIRELVSQSQDVGIATAVDDAKHALSVGHERLLAAPILVACGKDGTSFRVFDQDGTTLGSIIRVRNKGSGWRGAWRAVIHDCFELRDASERCVLRLVSQAGFRNWSYTICDPRGDALATIKTPGRGDCEVVEGTRAIAVLRTSDEPRPHQLRLHVQAPGRDIACIRQTRRGGYWYCIAEIHTAVPQSLRCVALAAMMIAHGKLIPKTAT